MLFLFCIFQFCIIFFLNLFLLICQRGEIRILEILLRWGKAKMGTMDLGHFYLPIYMQVVCGTYSAQCMIAIHSS